MFYTKKHLKDVSLEQPFLWAVLVAQLVERSHATQEVCGSNPVIVKLLSRIFVYWQLEKTKIKKKRP